MARLRDGPNEMGDADHRHALKLPDPAMDYCGFFCVGRASVFE
jgi:hypothetical protein